jgi:hypothetical protein
VTPPTPPASWPTSTDYETLQASRDALADENAEQGRVIAAALALHRPVDCGYGPLCDGCGNGASFTAWPCPTARALGGAI